MLPNDCLGIAPEKNAMGENAGSLALSFHGADDMEKIGIVTLFCGRFTPGKTLKVIGCRGKAGTPGLVGEWRIGSGYILFLPFKGDVLFACLGSDLEEQ